MSPPRFFVDAPLAAGQPIRLPIEVAHHAVRVLRLRDGAPIVLFDGRGGQYAARLHVGQSVALAQIEAFDPIERESPLRLTLVQALVAADKVDWIVEKAVELGVVRLLVVPMQRSVVRIDEARAARRLRHWMDVARAACCQCGRNRVPVVEFHGTFDAMLAALPPEAPRLLLLPTGDRDLDSACAGDRAVLMVGPEGGLAEHEILQAGRARFVPVQLGPRVLRTETAGLAALAALQAMHGDLCGPAVSPIPDRS